MNEDCKMCFFEARWLDIQNFFSDWIYPAYKLSNALFGRYDIVKMSELKRSEYSDDMNRMLHANMELIRHFIEEENPEEHGCWYRDEQGNDVGPKYGEKYKHEVMFHGYEGKPILDLVKKIYNWWTVERHKKQEECDYLFDFWSKHIFGKIGSRPLDGNERKDAMSLGLSAEGCDAISVMTIDTSQCPKCLDDFEGKEVDWSILDKYLDGDRNNLFKENFVHEKMLELEYDIFMDEQEYLHLCIEVRPHLWT